MNLRTLIKPIGLFVALLCLVLLFTPETAVFPVAIPTVTAATQLSQLANEPIAAEEVEETAVLSPIWGPAITQWESQIGVLSGVYGLHPDFIAAVIREESNGQPDGVSAVGAVGLMGVMPSGPGLEWRPSTQSLKNPSINLRWGVSILAEIVRQSGGDLHAALAAYSGGWAEVNNNVPQEYASNVLDNYGRAIVVRQGIDPEVAAQWTIGIELTKGNVTNETFMVLGAQPVSGLYTYGEHIVYNYIDQSGRSYYVRGYAVPVALVVPQAPLYGTEAADSPEDIADEMDEAMVKQADRNPRIILACLPSLGRLRGHVSTRWFAPSDCPDWHR